MTHTILPFSTSGIKALFIETTAECGFGHNSILINLSNSWIQPKNNSFASIKPWNSLLVQDQWVGNPGSVVSIEVNKQPDLAEECKVRWKKYNEIDHEYPDEIPLFISPQYSMGTRVIYPDIWFQVSEAQYSKTVKEDLNGAGHAQKGFPVDLKLNLWFAPAGTNCLIHRVHSFLELHTQIFGVGHMQKFRENNASTIYEDVIMLPGYTHEPFFTIEKDYQWKYPWHQYYCETDCIWMAIEFHPSINNDPGT